jgi:hypothetical protein
LAQICVFLQEPSHLVGDKSVLFKQHVYFLLFSDAVFSQLLINVLFPIIPSGQFRVLHQRIFQLDIFRLQQLILTFEAFKLIFQKSYLFLQPAFSHSQLFQLFAFSFKNLVNSILDKTVQILDLVASSLLLIL